MVAKTFAGSGETPQKMLCEVAVCVNYIEIVILDQACCSLVALYATLIPIVPMSPLSRP